MIKRYLLALLVGLALALSARTALAFDHTHAAWDALLKQNVMLISKGNASQLRYADVQRDHAALKAYLNALSAVTEAEFRTWSKPQQLAFLINSYNAFTVELVLTRYPDLKSIKEIGSLFKSPWKEAFVPLLGQQRSLDDIEHGIIRAPGAFDDPRIHFAVVCASVGCPMLRNDAFIAPRLDAQLDDAMRRFLSDRSRNRFDASSGELHASKIFDWYGKDFEQGHGGFNKLADVFAKYADELADAPDAQARIRSGDYRVEFLDYDWKLNDVRN